MWMGLLNAMDHVEISVRRLHHQHIGSFSDVELYFAQRLMCISGIHLMRAPISKSSGALGCQAERSIQTGIVFYRVTEDRNMFKASLIQSLAQSLYHSV